MGVIKSVRNAFWYGVFEEGKEGEERQRKRSSGVNMTTENVCDDIKVMAPITVHYVQKCSPSFLVCILVQSVLCRSFRS